MDTNTDLWSIGGLIDQPNTSYEAAKSNPQPFRDLEPAELTQVLTAPSPYRVTMATTADSSHTEVATIEQGDVVRQVFKIMQEFRQYFEVYEQKLSCIELRQSHASGETNDAIRAVQQWAQAESSCLPRKSLEVICDLVESKQLPTYYQAFVSKDIRRCEHELYKFYELFDKGNEYVADETQHSTGECFTMMPSVRSKIEQACKKDVELEQLPERLVLLYKLVKPMNRQYLPMGIKTMRELKIVPSYYDGFKDISDEEAKAIWQQFSGDKPKAAAEVDEIPLNMAKYSKCTWHEQLLLKIHEFNEHRRKVSVAESTIAEDEHYEETEETDHDKNKKAAEEHAKKLDKFWSKTDAQGCFCIERAASIKSKWAKKAEAEAKAEAEK